MVDHEPGSTHSPDNLLTPQFWYFTWNKKKSFCSVYSILFQQPSLSTMVPIAAYWWCCTPFHVYQSLGFCFKSFLLTHRHFRFAHYLFQMLILWCAFFIFSCDENEGYPVLLLLWRSPLSLLPFNCHLYLRFHCVWLFWDVPTGFLSLFSFWTFAERPEFASWGLWWVLEISQTLHLLSNVSIPIFPFPLSSWDSGKSGW